MTIGRNRDQEYKAMTCLQIQTGVHIYMISKRVEYSPAKLQCLHLQYLACHVGSDVLGVVVPGRHRQLQSSSLSVSIHFVVSVLSWLYHSEYFRDISEYFRNSWKKSGDYSQMS